MAHNQSTIMPYSQMKAMWSVTKASLRSTTRNVSAIVFSFIFPFVFIMIFGFLGNSGGMQTFNLVLEKGSDTNNLIYQHLKSSPGVKMFTDYDSTLVAQEQQKGKIAAIINISKTQNDAQPYAISMRSTTASNNKWPQVKSMIESTIALMDKEVYPNSPTYAKFSFDAEKDIAVIRQYKTIDFILPGQLGFSLMSAAIFGVAFMFFHLRKTLVLKRFYATPISRQYIILGEGLSRVIFQMITAVTIILVGHYIFGFTLINGWITVVEMLVLSFIGLMVFMGLGFFISGIAKSESTIPPLANLITLPQFLLGETFFSIDVFPSWLQPIARIMPLTYLNNALRSVAFEGLHLWQILPQIGVLLLWGVIGYFLASRTFKWD